VPATDRSGNSTSSTGGCDTEVQHTGGCDTVVQHTLSWRLQICEYHAVIACAAAPPAARLPCARMCWDHFSIIIIIVIIYLIFVIIILYVA
jgi:hypothetical protein